MKPEASYGEVHDDSNIICPNCGYKIEGWDYNLPEDDTEIIECEECGKSFQAQKNVTVSYTTTEILDTTPCNYCGGLGKHIRGTHVFTCSSCGGRGTKPYTASDKAMDELMGRTTEYTPASN